MKNVGYTIHLNCIEDTRCKLKTVILVLLQFVIPRLEVSSVPIATTINVINGKILILARLQKNLSVISVYL